MSKAKQVVVLSSGDAIDFSTVVSISKPVFVIQTRDSFDGNMCHIIEDSTGEVRLEAIEAFKESNRLERQLELLKFEAEINSLTTS